MLKLCMAGLVVVVVVVLVPDVWSHGHAHDDHHHGHSHDEPPAFKWSKQANMPEDEILEEDIETIVGRGHAHDDHGGHHGHAHDHGGHGHAHNHGGHGHSHGEHGHSHGGHGHSHGGHGHSHGGHGHSHGGHGHSHGAPAKEPAPEEREKMRQNLHAQWDDDEEHPGLGVSSVWIQAIGATLLISAAPFFILFFIPLDNSQEKQWLLKILLAFASGGLLGDALLHLIPHAQMAVAEAGHGHSHGGGGLGHGHSHGEEGHVHDMSVGLGVLSGLVSFLCVEKFVRIIKGGHGHSHGHSHGAAAPSKPAAQEPKDKDNKSKDGEEKDKKVESSKKKEEEKEPAADTKGDGKKPVEGKKKADDKAAATAATETVVEEIKVAGYLNLAADCFHNFTDGLAIGASFLAGESIGLITTFTILLHEVPHEIGDFAILIQSGVPKSKAIFLQLLTAVGALTGCVVSLMLDGVTDTASQLTLPFTAGGFIYIATVSVLPELLEGSTLKQSFMEVTALLLGIFMMVIIAQYE